MDSNYLIMIGHLGGALLAGSAIGLERSFNGRPAGFRTHSIVCLASAMLMLVTLYQERWLLPTGLPADAIRTDPTRMAQGIMTGIGFLGAGVIYKERFSVRGLTTAASIWMTSALGILFGIGFWFPAAVCTIATLGILSAFRWIESRMPMQTYAHSAITFARGETMSEVQVRDMLQQHGFTVANMSYRLSDDDAAFEYRMVIRTVHRDRLARLADSLRRMKAVRGFKISPTGD
jgi:putative Mg2+ transporter-C (MgtC) family protein